MRKREKPGEEHFGAVDSILTENEELDRRIWLLTKSKLEKKKKMRTKWVLSTACVCLAAVLTVAAALIFGGIGSSAGETPPLKYYGDRDLTRTAISFEMLKERCEEKNLLLPDFDSDVVDLERAYRLSADGIDFAYEACFIYNFDLQFVLKVSDRENYVGEKLDEKKGIKTVTIDTKEIRYQSAQNFVNCVCKWNDRKYFVQIMESERRILPVLQSIFGART